MEPNSFVHLVSMCGIAREKVESSVQTLIEKQEEVIIYFFIFFFLAAFLKAATVYQFPFFKCKQMKKKNYFCFIRGTLFDIITAVDKEISTHTKRYDVSLGIVKSKGNHR